MSRDEKHSIASLWVSAAAVLVMGSLGAYIASAEVSRPAQQTLPVIRSLAIPPFKPLVPTKRDDALQFGMADTLIAKIGSAHSLIVRPNPADVDAVLEGSILSAWDKLRVTVRLTRVADSKLLWQGQFDTTFAGIFAVQDAIASRVIDELGLPLSDSERRQLRKHFTNSPEAYRAYVRGRYLGNARDLERAVGIDPHYARAYAALAEASRSPDAAKRAIALDPENSDAWIVLGDYPRALELNPNSARAHIGLARVLSGAGRRTEAAHERAEALRLDPTIETTGSARSSRSD